jgi:hypothetical protein
VHEGQPGWKIVSESGFVVTLSESTPIKLRDGSLIHVAHVDGHELPCGGDDGELVWERCFAHRTEPISVCRLHIHQRCYGAGDIRGRMIYTHNPKN